MKKSTKIIAALLIVCAMICLISCGKDESELSGTYSMKELIPSDSFTFDGSAVTIYSKNIFNITAKGTYKISDGKIYIQYEELGVTKKVEYTFSQKDEKTIVIDGHTLKKS